MKIDKVKEILRGYPYPEIAHSLIKGFSEGFKLEYTGLRTAASCSNLQSADSHLLELREILLKEIQAGRILGPFSGPPLPNTRLSPLGVVPKKNELGKICRYRQITHLSYPRGGHSINSNIDPQKARVQYQSFDDAIRLCLNNGPGCYLTKTDLKSAFRQLPVHPSDLHLLGIRLDGFWFIDSCIPFGLSIACKLFKNFSTALHWHVAKIISAAIIHYLDDYLFGGKSHVECGQKLQAFMDFCQELGFPVAADKTAGPAQIMVFLGMTMDTVRQTIGIPPSNTYSWNRNQCQGH